MPAVLCSLDRLVPRVFPWWLAMLVACARTGGDDASEELHAAAPLPATTTPAVPLRLPPAMRDREWISIERTACYGACPQFTITATAAGSVEWLGVKDVHMLGVDYRVVDPAALIEIYAELASLDWLAIPQWSSRDDDDECSTDQPSTIVTLGRGNIARALYHYHGCGGEELTRMRLLEERLLELLAAPNWIEPGSGPTPPSDDPCRVMAFRPLFTPRPRAQWASFTNVALSTASRSIHEPRNATKIHVVAIDDGDAELAGAVATLGHAVERRLHGIDDVVAYVVEPAPNRPPPGETRMLVTPAGCTQGELPGADGW